MPKKTKEKVKKIKQGEYEEKLKFEGSFIELIDKSLQTKIPSKRKKK